MKAQPIKTPLYISDQTLRLVRRTFPTDMLRQSYAATKHFMALYTGLTQPLDPVQHHGIIGAKGGVSAST
jgi:hypothetical protein